MPDFHQIYVLGDGIHAAGISQQGRLEPVTDSDFIDEIDERLGVGTLGGATVSCQLQSSPNGTTWTNYGSAFGTAAGIAVQIVDLESFPASNIRCAVTIGGTSPSVPISIVGIGWLKYNP